MAAVLFLYAARYELYPFGVSDSLYEANPALSG